MIYLNVRQCVTSLPFIFQNVCVLCWMINLSSDIPIWLINFEISEPDVELKEVLIKQPRERLTSLPPAFSNSPPPTSSFPLSSNLLLPSNSFFPLFSITCIFLTTAENQHVLPGHKSGSVNLTCTCPLFTSSSFSLPCHSAPPPFLLPSSCLDQLAYFSHSNSKTSGYSELIELVPRKSNQTPSW